MKTNYLVLLWMFLSIFACSKDNESDPVPQETRNPVYLDANGITVKARDWARPGDKGTIDGIEYRVVDNFSIGVLLQSGNANVCTTRVTDMKGLFCACDFESGDFNKDISSWDVSNVRDMSEMFYGAYEFNQPIGVWDVSKVTNMARMFAATIKFNQDLSAWNTANVQDCADFSGNAAEWQQPKPSFANCNVD